MAAVGGMASIWGAALGVTFFFLVKEVLRARMHQLLGVGGEYELIGYGIILILVMIFMPQGLSFGGVKALDWLRNLKVFHRGGDTETEPRTEQAL